MEGTIPPGSNSSLLCTVSLVKATLKVSILVVFQFTLHSLVIVFAIQILLVKKDLHCNLTTFLTFHNI